MENNKAITTEQGLIYLSGCALHSLTPDVGVIKCLDLDVLLHLAGRHSIQSLVATALERAVVAEPSLKAEIDLDVFEQFKKIKAKATRRAILLDAEREKVLSLLEQNGIWYMPLKGSVLQQFYPSIGTRQMCDVDILFDRTERSRVRDLMLTLGYSIKQYSDEEFIRLSKHDSYVKQDMFLFEMHHSLAVDSKKEYNNFEYYKNVKNRLIKDSENNFGYHFSNEDFYIHLIAHAYCHFNNGGHGIRSLIDIFVYLNAKGDDFNRQYIERELDKLDAREFEVKVRSLAQKLFAKSDEPRGFEFWNLTEGETELLDFLLYSGVYGVKKTEIRQRVERELDGKASFKTKVGYILKRLFPNREYYKMKYPFCYKTRVLIPFAFLHRLVVRMFTSRKAIGEECKVIVKKK